MVRKLPAPVRIIFLFSVPLLFTVFLISLPLRLLRPLEMGMEEEMELHIYPRPEVKFSPPDCAAFTRNETCTASGPTRLNHKEDPDGGEAATCPDYFRWIHEDLRPWAKTGITREMLERAQPKADFRLVIVGGRAYVERYAEVFQSRDIFTLWGILQLLRWYPGKIPDLDLMFNCEDQPVVFARDYGGPGPGPNSTAPPPLFHYCGDDDTLDIVFPDWSFWGWPEINIKPWTTLLKDLKEGNQKKKWIDREPYAYWKGNTFVSKARYELLKCNVSYGYDWNARIYMQNWTMEQKEGFKESNLSDQCVYRYKVYVEGISWSVSLKYILACDSVTLMVNPYYYDFFARSLVPLHHYWPIKDDDMCKAIKFAVDWGNTHKQKAQEIGKAANKFIQEKLSMENVYDYMFHSLNEYSKLLSFKPTITSNAIELCLEKLVCATEGLTTKFMMDSLVKRRSYSSPCSLPPPFSLTDLDYLRTRKETPIKQVQMWEKDVQYR